MADDPTITGEWGTVSFVIPDFLEDVRDVFNDYTSLLVSILEVVNVALEFVKAFIKGSLDPLAALIEVLIKEIISILRSIREIGLYITGDWALLGWPPEDLRGGFAEYERRMIARLSDRTDKTRPELSSKTKVLGFFAYLSVAPTEFEQLIDFIGSLMKMFGLSFFPDTSTFPVPQIQSTLYGPEAASVFNFSSLMEALDFTGSPPQHCRVTWTAKPASLKSPFSPVPALGPSGYLVTVSTLPNGIHLIYGRGKANSGKKAADGDSSRLVVPQEYGPVIDKRSQPVILHGGAEMLSFKGSPFEFNKNINEKTRAPKDGACQVFGKMDPASNEIILLEALGEADALGRPGDGKGIQFLLQRTFLVESDVALAQWFAGEYSVVLSLDDMPQNARFVRGPENKFTVQEDGPATHYYVRIFAVGSKVAEREVVPQWDFTTKEVATNAKKSGQPFVIEMKSGKAGKAGKASIGNPSSPRKITFAGNHTGDYLKALETALLVLVLSRADMPLLSEVGELKGKETMALYTTGKFAGQFVATKATGFEGSRHIIRKMFPNIEDMSKPDQSPMQWRTDLHAKIRQVALDIYERTGPMPESEKIVVDGSVVLRTVSWAQIIDEEEGLSSSTYQKDVEDRSGSEETIKTSIFDSLDPKSPLAGMTEHGIAPNLMSMDMKAADVDELFYNRNALRGRKEEFIVWEDAPLGNVVMQELDPTKLRLLADDAPRSLARLYEGFTNRDNQLTIPFEWQVYISEMQKRLRTHSSGDHVPVWVGNQTLLRLFTYGKDLWVEDEFEEPPYWPGAVNLRFLLRNYQQGLLFREAAAVLQIATAAYTRSPGDGEWIALRLFDSFPDLEAFFNEMENWVKTLAFAVKSMADAISKYIEFVQAQITELQQLTRRINAMIQSILTFTYAMPQFNGLMLLSDGTDGLMADLVAADNKPSDSPLSYGGGIGLVVPFGPSFLFDLIAVAGGESPDPTKRTVVTPAPDAIGIEQIEPAAGAPPSDEPDVL